MVHFAWFIGQMGAITWKRSNWLISRATSNRVPFVSAIAPPNNFNSTSTARSWMLFISRTSIPRASRRMAGNAPIAEWLEIRRKIDADILDNFWDNELQSFVQVKSEKTL